jgi:PhzF family phenazine biosynthesis protein
VRIPFFHVDAFSPLPFAGNPAAICLLDAPADEAWMRKMAADMNLSETAFVTPGEGAFGLRWFTPRAEVALCGHATLAAAHVLWESGRLAAGDQARFDTLSGRLTAALDDGWISLDFPPLPVEPGPIPEQAVRALGVEPVSTAHCGPRWLVEVANAEAVVRAAPDFGRLRSMPGRAVILTARADEGSGFDFVSRYFAPWVGVDEDPVTGSAHCALGPFWGPRLGSARMTAYQASPRGGTIRVSLAGNRVILAGQAATVIAGTVVSRDMLHETPGAAGSRPTGTPA